MAAETGAQRAGARGDVRADALRTREGRRGLPVAGRRGVRRPQARRRLHRRHAARRRARRRAPARARSRSGVSRGGRHLARLRARARRRPRGPRARSSATSARSPAACARSGPRTQAGALGADELDRARARARSAFLVAERLECAVARLELELPADLPKVTFVDDARARFAARARAAALRGSRGRASSRAPTPRRCPRRTPRRSAGWAMRTRRQPRRSARAGAPARGRHFPFRFATVAARARARALQERAGRPRTRRVGPQTRARRPISSVPRGFSDSSSAAV